MPEAIIHGTKTVVNNHYLEKLYPFQDIVLKLINELKLPFYLTGGTALSRYYLNHRFSDDLDLFVNADRDFKNYVTIIEKHLSDFGITMSTVTRADDFVRIVAQADDSLGLIIDLVNDIAFRVGESETSPILGNIDNLMNILSNKIAAIPRLEIKDFVDVLFISKKFQFSWHKIMDEAYNKDSWVNAIDVSKYFDTVDISYLDKVNWIETVDHKILLSQMKIIAQDILLGKNNSLYSIG